MYLIKAKKENYARFGVVIPTIEIEIDINKMFAASTRTEETLVHELSRDENIEIKKVEKQNKIIDIEVPEIVNVEPKKLSYTDIEQKSAQIRKSKKG